MGGVKSVYKEVGLRGIDVCDSNRQRRYRKDRERLLHGGVESRSQRGHFWNLPNPRKLGNTRFCRRCGSMEFTSENLSCKKS